MIRTIIFLLVLASSFAAHSKNFDAIYDHYKYQNAKISPDGKYIALSMFIDGKLALAFLDSKTKENVGGANFGGRSEVGDFHWANNERVVIKVVQREPWLEEPQFYGELFAINADGGRAESIYGYRSGDSRGETGTKIKRKKAISGWGEIIDILKEDERHILVSSTPMSSTGERLASALKLNIYNGIVRKDLGMAPLPFSRHITDIEGKIKAVVGTDRNNNEQVYLRENGQWERISEGIVGSKVHPLSLSASSKYLYTIDNYDGDKNGIYRLNTNDFTYKKIFKDKTVDIADVEMTTDGRSAYAILLNDGYPNYLILNKKLEEAKVFKELLATFPYSSVSITSKTENGAFYIVKVSSDINPGSLYLYDKQKNKLEFLFRLLPDFNDNDFRQMEPIKIPLEDGTSLHGYFTQAKAKEGEIAPVVVLVHGGPHGVRDTWRYSRDVQYLASHGYSVLQVNYRGSGGYGYAYEAAGYQSWGTTIQQDIYSGIKWLVKQKKAEEKNVCIMGASFGAYSAVHSSALYPDTYKCVVANAGIYDLNLMFEEGDIRNRRSGLSYLRSVLGTDKEILKAMSPVHHTEKIKAPILLAHGKEDERAPYEHAELLREALDESGKSYEWFVLEDEEHGFYNPENQKEYMRTVIQFLDKHLK